MAEEAEKTTKDAPEAQKKKQKNLLVLFAVAVLVGVGAYYFMNSKNMNSSMTPNDSNTVSQAPDNSNSGSSELTSKKWTWVNTQMSDGATSVPSNEGEFTLTLQPDMRALATTDCNNGNGSYELGPDNALTFGPMATTMMFCDGSTETEFYQGLSNVGSYKISDGQLWLMLKFDSGTMIFE